MKVFIFDLLPYRENLDYLKKDGELPRPLGRRYFKPEEQIKTYAEHLEAWEEMERLGFDGVVMNEHHGTPYGTMNSPNLLAASIIQRTKRMKICIYGNLLPIHEPLRLAEELAMLDCLSNGRLIAGVARGAPREYRFYNIAMAESRARFEECFEVMRKAWTQESFSHEGEFFSYKDVAIWPRPVQRPYPQVWLPVTGSKESIEWAAKWNVPITPGSSVSGGEAKGDARRDIIRYYAECQAREGRRVTPDHFVMPMDCYIADSKAQAIDEYAPYVEYWYNTLYHFDHVTRDRIEKGYYSDQSTAYMRNRSKTAVANDTAFEATMNRERIVAQAENSAWGTADEIVERVIGAAEHCGASTVLISCNRGAMPQEMFLNQIRRLGKEVLPRLQGHNISGVKFADDISPLP